MDTIGGRIKKRRKQLKLNVDDMAKKLGKNRATIYRYESNEIENMPMTILAPIALVLKTTPAYLMGWSDNPNLENPQTMGKKLEKLIEKIPSDHQKEIFEDIMDYAEMRVKKHLNKTGGN